ncbi:MAG: phosphopantothenoylcysteine decarboxylase [Planctomycetota bacterium]
MLSLRVVITAGPTREHFDSVRFISNASSGRMGYAIAEAARDAGHRVTLISGPVEIAPPRGVKTIRVVSAAEMARETRLAFHDTDAAIFAAAVSDYRPKARAKRKGPKSSRDQRIVLVPTVDIAASLGRIKGRRVTIGFALEDHNGRAHAEAKLARKSLDAIILNDPSNIGSDRASAELLRRDGPWVKWPRSSKRAMARRIVAELERLAQFSKARAARGPISRPTKL